MSQGRGATSQGAPLAGIGWGLLGVVAFSFTVPFTRVAVGGLPPLFIGAGRACVAAALAALALLITRQRIPRGSVWIRLTVVGAGVVLGFPLFTTFALRSVPATHAAIVIALLPAATAAAAVIRGHERPPLRFWILAAAGAVATMGFIALQGEGLGDVGGADILLLAAVASAATGYAEGAQVSRELGAWQTVSWALLLCAPVTVILAVVGAASGWGSVTATQWWAFLYLGVVSMFLGFFAWYAGLAIGPVAQVSQVQLIQPVLSVTWAVLLLGEVVSATTAGAGLLVILLAAAAVRTRVTATPQREPTEP